MTTTPTPSNTSPAPGSSRIHPKAIRARRNRRLLVVAGLVLIATVVYLNHWWTHDRFWVRTDNAYVTGNLVPVAAQASGIVTQVLAEETQFVNRGDLMIRLDEHQAYAALGRARGHLGEEVRRIAALFMTRKQLAEQLASRAARVNLALHDMARYRAAAASGAAAKGGSPEGVKMTTINQSVHRRLNCHYTFGRRGARAVAASAMASTPSTTSGGSR